MKQPKGAKIMQTKQNPDQKFKASDHSIKRITKNIYIYFFVKKIYICYGIQYHIRTQQLSIKLKNKIKGLKFFTNQWNKSKPNITEIRETQVKL